MAKFGIKRNSGILSVLAIGLQKQWSSGPETGCALKVKGVHSTYLYKKAIFKVITESLLSSRLVSKQDNHSVLAADNIENVYDFPSRERIVCGPLRSMRITDIIINVMNIR